MNVTDPSEEVCLGFCLLWGYRLWSKYLRVGCTLVILLEQNWGLLEEL